MTKAEQIPFPFFPTELAANDSSGESAADQAPTPTLLACSDEEWEGILEDIRNRIRLPRGHKIVFHRYEPEEDSGRNGWTTKPGRRQFEVGISKGLTYDHTIDLTLHEIAHTLDWNEHSPWREDHSPTFWIHLGEVYCAYHQVR